ncbi:MAG: hypothetical protein E6H57_13365 [Betaproteobacteria bacterium]|nr:MAG: hypothetical protein E6H57_13365 [Betaproteobacteria bacterium]
MKLLLAAIVLLLCSCALADAPQPWRAVDLDRPGALEALKLDHPGHFAKVEKILSEAPQRPYASVRGWMRTEFDARDVDTSYLMKTSYPALARITFTLDERQYTKVIRIDAPAKAVPAK